MLREADVALAQGIKEVRFAEAIGYHRKAQRRIAEQGGPLHIEIGKVRYRELAAGVQHDPAPLQSE
jgi:hypothetical protein